MREDIIIKLNSFFEFFKFIADLNVNEYGNTYLLKQETVEQKSQYLYKIKNFNLFFVEDKSSYNSNLLISLDVFIGNKKQSKSTSLYFYDKEFNNYSEEILNKLIKIIDTFILSDEFINKKFEIYQHNKKLESKLINKSKEKRLKI